MKRSSIAALALMALAGCAGTVRVMTLGHGDGAVVSAPVGLACNDRCEARFARDSVVSLRAVPAAGSSFEAWGGDCNGSAATCDLDLDRFKAVTARFVPSIQPRIAPGPLSGEVVRDFLAAEPAVNTPAAFVAAIGGLGSPYRFKDNWIFMARSESLQTGHAASPRVLMPSQDAKNIFSFALSRDPAFPHADPNKIEYIEFQELEQRFRFHEIDVAARTVTLDAPACFQCHAGRPNWDAYDSWAGMMPFNRDRVYKGSVDAAALRSTLNLRGWPSDARKLLDQLNLPTTITRQRGGLFDGVVQFPMLDDVPVVLAEPNPASVAGVAPDDIAYPAGSAAARVQRGGTFFHLFNSVVTNPADVGLSSEGRGVDLFDQLTSLNGLRIARELIDHPRTPVDARPIALAVAADCDIAAWTTAAQRGFFDARNRVTGLADMETITTERRRSLPALKIELERKTLTGPKGLLAVHGPATALGNAATAQRLNQEVFRRPRDLGYDDLATRKFVDRETIAVDVARFRYFLEPLGVAVGKWSMSVAGRSRTYTFADLFPLPKAAIRAALESSLGLGTGAACATIEPLVRTQFANLPDADARPAYREVQRVFDRHCLQCHGSFNVEGGPYAPSLVQGLSASQLLRPPAPTTPRVVAGNPSASRLFLRLTSAAAPMPPAANGPALSGAEIDLIRRWIAGGALEDPAPRDPAPPVCQGFADAIAETSQEIRDLQVELRDAPPGAKPAIAGAIRRLQAAREQMRAAASGAGCSQP